MFIRCLLQSTHRLLYLPTHGGDSSTHNHRRRQQSGAGDFLNHEVHDAKHKGYSKPHSLDSPFDRNISKSTRADSCSSGLPIADRASMVSSSSKRFSSIGLLYTVVFFMITSFGTAKIQNYIKLSTEISDCQFVNF